MWLVYADGADAAIASALISRRYLRLQSADHVDGLVVDLQAGALISGASVADDALGPFLFVLPGRRSGVIVADGVTERWSVPQETASGDWAVSMPAGWDVADVVGLPAGYTTTDDPVFPDVEGL
jgi:hypothetical protein